MKKRLLILFLLICAAPSVWGQKWAVETNVLDWANFATANFEVSRRINRYSAAVAGVRYNPWKFRDSSGSSHQNRALGANIGVRFWPWHIYSGWWFAVKAQAEEYSRGGIFKMSELHEGYALGASLSAGYALMVGDHWNLSFGIGGWVGYTDRTVYKCPDCGRKLSEYKGPFLLPDNETKVGVTYVF